MKTLVLVRHAKSSWDDPTLADQDRPLNARGIAAATRMGQWISEKGLIPDLLLVSPAERTRQTTNLMLTSWADPPRVNIVPELYHCSAAELRAVLREVADDIPCVMVIGHNPGLAEFLLAAVNWQKKFPTAACAWLTTPIARWSELNVDSRFELEQICRPKDLA